MYATPDTPTPPVPASTPPVLAPAWRRRVVGAWLTPVAWGAAIAYPFALYFAMLDGRGGFSVLTVAPLIILTALLGVLLRSRPLPALALLLVGWAAARTQMQNPEVAYLQVLLGDLAVGCIAAVHPRRTSVPAAALAFAGQLGTHLSSFGQTPGRAAQLTAFLALATLAAWLAGDSVRERRTHAEVLGARAAEQAVTAERLRIARELHDMIAHSIGVIAIQAGVGSRVIDTQPAEARNALSTIEATSRETLAGLRGTLVALRKPTGHGRDGEDGPAPLEPAPGLADVERLVASTRDAGVRARLHRRGEPRPLPADIDLAAFRILQEALTNVVRHAGTDVCRVTIDYGGGDGGDGEVTVEVVDDGVGKLPAGGGYGLVGMRERVALLHGDFTAGPLPEGGFRVAARLPTPAGDAR
ncbi:two-component sensor histidine kinase [Streptomyces sp. WAC 01529]|uniref:sensor histidine kinase n=1 Tax=Streptomyces sp. WAC 01529 TaxID=2203205 RepID=UPI000F6EF374|nr:sensor histidine kinase [Streptomyces sp. WAC 01529]AZM52419.1 two-component sensor histidine kinase [Streptomyces sp. WAC 01529]